MGGASEVLEDYLYSLKERFLCIAIIIITYSFKFILALKDIVIVDTP